MRLLIDLALVVRYSYNFCKRLIECATNWVANVLRENLPSIIFELLTGVVSAILEHLMKIQWKAIVNQLGGWVRGGFSWVKGTFSWVKGLG